MFAARSLLRSRPVARSSALAASKRALSIHEYQSVKLLNSVSCFSSGVAALTSLADLYPLALLSLLSLAHKQYGIATPEAKPAFTAEEAEQVAKSFGQFLSPAAVSLPKLVRALAAWSRFSLSDTSTTPFDLHTLFLPLSSSKSILLFGPEARRGGTSGDGRGKGRRHRCGAQRLGRVSRPR